MQILLELCRQLDGDSQWLRRYDALSPDQWKPNDQVEMGIVLDRRHEASDQITTLSATRAAGIRAKAAALGHALIQAIAIDPSRTFEEQAEDYELLAMSLVRDLSGEVIHG